MIDGHILIQQPDPQEEKMPKTCKITDSENIDEDKANNLHRVQYIKDELLNGAKKPREVEIYFYLWKLHEIDTVGQSFTITITTSLTWIEDNTEKNFNVANGDGKWEDDNFKWNPQVKFMNIIEEDDVVKEEWFKVTPSTMARASINSKTSVSKRQWMNKYKESNVSMRVTQFMRRKMTI